MSELQLQNSNQTSHAAAENELDAEKLQSETAQVEVASVVSGIELYFAPLEARHRELLEAEMQRQRITDPSKLIHSNEGAYDDVLVRIGELYCGGRGLVLLKAVRQAQAENELLAIPTSEREARRSSERQYLGDISPQSLLRGSNVGRTHRGGGGGNRTVIRRNPVTDKDEMVQQMGAKPVPSGGGSEGRSRKERKFPKRCIYDDCILQYCVHRTSSSGRETVVTSVRISKRANEIIRQRGEALSHFVERMAELQAAQTSVA